MGKDKIKDSSYVLAELLDERQNSIVVHPNQFLVIVQDGSFQSDGSLQLGAELTIIRTEGKHTIRHIDYSESKLFGKKVNVKALLMNGSPYTLEFLTPSPDEIDVNSKSNHIVPILSKDGIIIPLQISIVIAIDPDRATSLFRLPNIHTSGQFTVNNLKEMFHTDLMANIVAPTIEKYNAEEIRGNESVKSELLQRLIDISETYFDWYGVRLAGNKMAVEWKLTEEEINRIKERELRWEERLSSKEEPENLLIEATKTSNVQTGIHFENTGSIGGGVNIEQNIQGGIHIKAESQGSNAKTNIFRKIISIIGVVGAIGSGIIFTLRILEII